MIVPNYFSKDQGKMWSRIGEAVTPFKEWGVGWGQIPP